MNRQITDLRQSIDQIDQQLAQLFIQRMQVVSELAKVKQQAGLAINDPQREAQQQQLWNQWVPLPWQRAFGLWMAQLVTLAKEYQQHLQEEDHV